MKPLSTRFQQRTWVLITSICVLFLSLSCEKEIELSGNIVNDPELLGLLYEQAADTIEVENQKIAIETYLYRNFTPGVLSSEKNHRVIASLFIINIDSLPITGKLKVEELYVINNEQIWVSRPKTQEIEHEYMMRFVSLNGPEWDTGTFVDVILKIQDLDNPDYKYLISRDQSINRVE